MRLLLAVLFSASIIAVAGLFDAATAAVLSLVVAGSFSVGRVIGELLDFDEPFGEFTLGFTLLSYLILTGLRLLPSQAHWILCFLLLLVVVHAVYCLFKKHFSRALASSSLSQLFCGAMVAALTVIWNLDNFARLRTFYLTGKFDFWVDIFVHAARLSELGGRIAAGRGNSLLADFPTPPYHFASYAPSALVLAVTDGIPLNIAALIWVPMGCLVMLTGILGLGYALGGRRLALWLIPAIASVPVVDGFPLYNGFFSFPWLLEAGPGAFYGLGGSCAAIALLILWMKGGRWPLLAGAIIMTFAIFLVRANFFVWVAPLVGLATVYDARAQLTKVFRLTPWFLSALCLIALIVGLVTFSWFDVADNTQDFLVSYLRFSHMNNAPTAYDGIFDLLEGQTAQFIALMLSLPLTFLAIQGIWLPLFLVVGGKAWSKGLWRSWDSIPILLMLVAAIFTYLGPIPPNGDISEFRHRATPLILVITMVWTVNFALLILKPMIEVSCLWRARHNLVLGLVTITSLAMMYFTIAHVKVPRMDWRKSAYGIVYSGDLAKIAGVLREHADRQSRFVIAGGSPDARIVDEAAVIVALSGVPAFMSCPQSILLRDDQYGDDARRRVAIQTALDSAESLKDLHKLMAVHKITQYIVLDDGHAKFDSSRSHADWSENGRAIYEVKRD